MDIGSLAVDTGKSEDGVWQDIGVFSVKLAFASLSNKAFQKKVKDLTDPHRVAIAHKFFSADKALALNYEAFASTVVKDWKGLTRDGVEVPYSVAECVALFQSNPKIFETIQTLASDDAAYRVEAIQSAAGN